MPAYTDDYETKVTLEAGGGNALPDEMPFRLLLLGDWSGSGRRSRYALSNSNLRDRRPILIDRDNFEDVMRKFPVELNLDLEGNGEKFLRLRFEEIDDFHPDKIFHQVPVFADLRDVRKRLSNPQTFNAAAGEVRQWLGDSNENDSPVQGEAILSQAVESYSTESGNFLDQILSQSNVAPESRSQAPVTDSKELNSLLGTLVRPHLIQTDEAEQSKLLEAVDQATGELMRAILHHPEFQALEAAWRGAFLVVSRTETDAKLKIYLLDASKEELQDDLKSVGNLTESGFYRLLIEKTPGNYGDESWAAVCADYVFNPDVNDAAALMRIAQICADAETPFVAQAGSKILGVESVAETPEPDDWNLRADSSESKLWSMLRTLPEASYLGLAIPRLMARMPYGAKSEPTETFSFEEFEASPVHESYLWTNPAFVCAVMLARSFTSEGWKMEPAAAQELDDLPMHIYKENGESKIKAGAEFVMTLKAAEKILDQGLMPLLSFQNSDRVRLGRFQSIAEPSTPLRGKWKS